MRPLSQHSNSSGAPKPNFQTKMKSRLGSSEVRDWQNSTHSRRFSMFNQADR